MSWITVVIVVAAATLVLVGGAFLVSARRLRRMQDAMTGFADRYELQVDSGERPDELTISGEIEGTWLAIETGEFDHSTAEAASGGDGRRTRLKARVPLPSLDVSFRPHRLGEPDGGLTLGVPELDEAYVFDGRPQRAALAFLRDERVLSALRRLHDRLPEARLRDGLLEVDREGDPDALEDLEEVADPLAACAETLSEVGADFELGDDRTPEGNLPEERSDDHS